MSAATKDAETMDLLDFDNSSLYFDEPLADEVDKLLTEAAVAYSEGTAELPLLRALLRAPESLTVLVGLYRFYFYQHRYQDAIVVADRACALAARTVGFPAEWQGLTAEHLSGAVIRSMGLVRFYLLALKAAGYICLRLDRIEEGRARLAKVRELDPPDRLGAGALLEVIDARFGGDPQRDAAA